MSLKKNDTCECFPSKNQGPILCEHFCSWDGNVRIACYCDGFIKGSNKSRQCDGSVEVGHSIFERLNMKFSPPFERCTINDKNSPTLTTTFKCLKTFDDSKKVYFYNCSDIPHSNSTTEHEIATPSHTKNHRMDMKKAQVWLQSKSSLSPTHSYESPPALSNSTTSTSGEACRYAFLGILILGFISIISYFLIRRRGSYKIVSNSNPNQSDNREM